MRNLSTATLDAVLEPALAALGYSLWGCQIEFSRRPVIRIFIDKSGGITVDDCSAASHHIKGVLAVEVKSLEDYVLEVSSPGMDRELFKREQYEQVVGNMIKFRLKRPMEENQRNFQAKLEKSEQNTLIFNTGKGLISVEFDNIERAHVVPDMNSEGKKR